MGWSFQSRLLRQRPRGPPQYHDWTQAAETAPDPRSWAASGQTTIRKSRDRQTACCLARSVSRIQAVAERSRTKTQWLTGATSVLTADERVVLAFGAGIASMKRCCTSLGPPGGSARPYP